VSEETQAARLQVNIAASQQQGTVMTQRKFTVPSGYTQGSVDLNGDGKADVVSIDNRATPFVARFDRKGTLLWVRAFSQKERVAILDLATSVDQIAVSGLYKERLDLDQDGRPDAAADPDGKSEGFVAILDNGPAERAHGRMTLS